MPTCLADSKPLSVTGVSYGRAAVFSHCQSTESSRSLWRITITNCFSPTYIDQYMQEVVTVVKVEEEEVEEKGRRRIKEEEEEEDEEEEEEEESKKRKDL